VEEPTESRTFEATFAELQQAVEQLELGGLPLERSLDLFERGMELVGACHTILDQAELRLTRLVDDESELLDTESPDWPLGQE
jgi:exodeoxyribonuclease VII small subunit